VFALRWNRRGDLLLTSSADESTVVWDVATSSVKQQFSFHGGEPRGLGHGRAPGCAAAACFRLLPPHAFFTRVAGHKGGFGIMPPGLL